jgi:hypothetical protein
MLVVIGQHAVNSLFCGNLVVPLNVTLVQAFLRARMIHVLFQAQYGYQNNGSRTLHAVTLATVMRVKNAMNIRTRSGRTAEHVFLEDVDHQILRTSSLQTTYQGASPDKGTKT